MGRWRSRVHPLSRSRDRHAGWLPDVNQAKPLPPLRQARPLEDESPVARISLPLASSDNIRTPVTGWTAVPKSARPATIALAARHRAGPALRLAGPSPKRRRWGNRRHPSCAAFARLPHSQANKLSPTIPGKTTRRKETRPTTVRRASARPHRGDDHQVVPLLF